MMKLIKKFLKTGFGKIMGAENDRIMQAVSKADVISFDIFDTLVKRNIIEPEHIHNIVHDKFMKQTKIDISEYPKRRIAAEKEARKHSLKEEITLKDIFAHLNGISETDKIALQKLEEEEELAVCCPDLRMKEIYIKALQNGKRIIITSDMYLKEEVIKKILHKCGYESYEKLYLSSSYGKCKATGSIYEVIKTEFFAFKGKILHIGDNVKSDYVIPKMRNLDALLVDGKRNLLRFWKNGNKEVEDPFLYQRLYSFLNNHVKESNNKAISIGYEIVGPMLLGYCVWLNEKIKKDSIEKIFFLSREGKIIQKAFNILYPQSSIPQIYLSVSRQALCVSLLADVVNFDEMIDTLKPCFNLPLLRTLRILCGLDQKQFIDELLYIGLSEETKIYEIPDGKKEAVYSIIKKLGQARFKTQKKYVIKYLEQNNFIGNIAIVDVGWVGTMQDVLQKYVSASDTVIHGYYLGVRNIEADNYYDGFHKKGYLFEPGKNKDFDLMIRFTTGIFEILFLNQTGSVQEYDLDKGCVVPILDESEYAGTEGEFIESLQAAALEFLSEIKADEIWKESMTIQADIIKSPYSRYAVYPGMDTINIFEEFKFSNSGNIRKLLPEYGLFYYIVHLKKLKQDWNESICKVFFMKKLFKFSLPYFGLLKLLVLKFHL